MPREIKRVVPNAPYGHRVGAPVAEIEITPAMAEAGARVLIEHYPEETGPLSFETGVASEVFLAMCRASL
jgi:hypothetical protein